jgi:hypothetical protein
LNQLCVRYNELSISGAFAGFLKSMIEILAARAEERKRAGALPDEQDSLVQAIEMLGDKYERITANLSFPVSLAIVS